MRMPNIRTVLELFLSVAVVVGGGVIFRQSARLAEVQRVHAQDARALERLRSALREEQARNPGPAASLPAAAPAPAPGHPPVLDPSILAAHDASIQQLHQELEEAQTETARLQAQLKSSAEEKQSALAAAAEDFEKREQEWRDRIASFGQRLDSARAEAQAARERSASLEADIAKLRTENTAAAARAAELRTTIASLQDLERRRDVHLNSVLRRYRDLTSQFRTMAGALGSSHGAESSSFNGVELNRLQNAISLAEDDLRRLNEVNAQTRRLESKLGKN